LKGEKMNKMIRFNDIQDIGAKFNLEFCMPPFDRNIDECFFDIDKFKETEDFQVFIEMIINTGIPYEYAKANKKIYLTIKVKDLHKFKV